MQTSTHRYGEHADQFAESTRPAGTPRGVAVVVHGGFWKPAYGIEYARPLAPSLAASGWVVWAIEYRRGTGSADTLADVRTAIAARPDLDGPVVAIGHSAGGHLAAWVASQDVGITHVVAQAAVLDLVSAHEEGLGGGAVERFLGHAPDDGDAAVDPIRQLPLGVPVTCVHARDDDIVPISQSRAYAAAGVAVGDHVEMVEVAGDHFTLIDPHSPVWGTTVERLSGIR